MKAQRRLNDNIGSDLDKSHLPKIPATRVPMGANVIINTIKGVNKSTVKGAKSSS